MVCGAPWRGSNNGVVVRSSRRWLWSRGLVVMVVVVVGYGVAAAAAGPAAPWTLP